MSKSLDELIDELEQPIQLQNFIENLKDVIKEFEFIELPKIEYVTFSKSEDTSSAAEQQYSIVLNYILIRVLTSKPKLLDDSGRDALSACFKINNIKAKGLVTFENLKNLSESSNQLLTWLKFEFLLVHLIKEQIYDSRTLANEVLATVKHELSPEVASKFSSVIGSCVKYCRSVNGKCDDEEEEEKWCEIIDWLSWFIGSGEIEH